MLSVAYAYFVQVSKILLWQQLLGWNCESSSKLMHLSIIVYTEVHSSGFIIST